MHRQISWMTMLVCALALGACGGEGEKKEDAEGGKAPPAVSEPPANAPANPLATAKGSIEHQLALLKAQKVEELRACFTPRLQSRITAANVEKAQGDASGMTIDDLWSSAKEGEYEGKKTMKVKMQSGRTLTTLVLSGDRWLSDTVWFQ